MNSKQASVIANEWSMGLNCIRVSMFCTWSGLRGSSSKDRGKGMFVWFHCRLIDVDTWPPCSRMIEGVSEKCCLGSRDFHETADNDEMCHHQRGERRSTTSKYKVPHPVVLDQVLN